MGFLKGCVGNAIFNESFFSSYFGVEGSAPIIHRHIKLFGERLDSWEII